MSFKRVVRNARKKVPISTVQWILFSLLMIVGVITGIIIAEMVTALSKMDDIQELEKYSQYSVPTKIYDINGDLITEFFYERREIVSYKDLPDNLVKSIIATEDQKFWTHPGFNLVAMFQGVIIDPLRGKSMRGGSGITQQLAKGLFTEGERTVGRKLVELWYSIQIEKKYSKEEILELYFNMIYFGHGCYGIQSASQYYFNKDVNDLTLGESSFLVGLPKAPSTYSPFLNPYKAQERHKVVLNSMAEEGYITDEQAEETFFEFWGNFDQTFKADGISANIDTDNPAPYFTEYVRGILLDEYGEEVLYSGGLSVYTTLNIEMQKVAKEKLVEGIEDAQDKYDDNYELYESIYREKLSDQGDLLSLMFGIDRILIGQERTRERVLEEAEIYSDLIYLSSMVFGLDELSQILSSQYMLDSLVAKKQEEIQGALISINPTNGYILAMVGGKEFNFANQYNRAVLAERSMGSSFKPIYYAVAIENRLCTAATVFSDEPIVYENEAGATWEPRNYSGTFKGDQRLRTALQYSRNIIAVQVWDLIMSKIGYTPMIKTVAKFFGLTEDEARERVQPQYAYSLGVGGFTPLECARAFSAFANGGKSIEPIAILKVVDRYGRVVNNFELERELTKDDDDEVISPAAAYVMRDMLSTVLFSGTGASAVAEAGFYYPAGGKTGTTSNWKDAWFSGFTKNVCTVVWIGFDDSTKSLGSHQNGTKVAAPIWAEYMADVIDEHPGYFTMPAGVTSASVCDETGLLATAFCPDVISEYFISGTIPTEYCDKHKAFSYDLLDDYQISSITDINIQDYWEKKGGDDIKSLGSDDYDPFSDLHKFDEDFDMSIDLDLGID